jgi:RHS repeat-associated protein
VTNDFLHAYSWDANDRPITIDGVGVIYDAFGRMAEQNRSGAYTEIVYAPTGGKLALMNGQSLTKAFVPLPAGSTAVYNSTGLAYYRHSDWVGSSRFASTPGRTMYFDAAYAPFGEPYAQTGTTDLSFTGMNQDTVANLYDFPAREYGIQGRWPSPDPAGISSVRRKDPQTWNRYAYVRNQPTSLIDPNGECTAPPGGNGVCLDLYIPTQTVPGSFGLGLGDNRGPHSDGGTFRDQILITADPSTGIAVVTDQPGTSEIGAFGVAIFGMEGTANSTVTGSMNADGSMTLNINETALNAFAGLGILDQPIEMSISLTANTDGTWTVNSGSTYSGYPALEGFAYQNGQATQEWNVPAGNISQLGTNQTPIPPGNGVQPTADSPINGPSGDGSGLGDCACDNLEIDATIMDHGPLRGQWPPNEVNFRRKSAAV